MLLVRIFSLRYPACEANVPYFQMWLATLYNNYRNYLLNDTIFRGAGKKTLNTKCVIWFSLQLLSQTHFILTIIKGNFIINEHRSSCKATVFFSGFN